MIQGKQEPAAHLLWGSSSCAIKVQVDCSYALAVLVVGNSAVLSLVSGLHTADLQHCNVVKLLISFEHHVEARSIYKLLITVEPDERILKLVQH